MSFANYTNEALLNSLFGKTSNFGALGSAPTIYVGLSSTEPGEDGSNINEPTGGSYARVSTSSSDWNAATSTDPPTVTNANQLNFPTATADWLSGSDLTWGVLFDSSSGGNYLGKGQLSTAKPVLNGDTAQIAAGDLSVSND